MCGLFGAISYGNKVSKKDLISLISALGEESTERGTDANGVSFVENKIIKICKKPLPSYDFNFNISGNYSVVMGHTRHATHGNCKNNSNNHPFLGHTKSATFSFAHNGIISNYDELRRSESLPKTKIETDSYVVVQMLEKQGFISLNSIKEVIEKTTGSFCYTILDNKSNMYLVKGKNPLTVFHNKKLKLYVYASTEEILLKAIINSNLFKDFKPAFGKENVNVEEIKLESGQILKIDASGKLTYKNFTIKHMYDEFDFMLNYQTRKFANSLDDYEIDYIRQLKYACKTNGYDGETIDILLDEGYTFDEIEELVCFETPIF